MISPEEIIVIYDKECPICRSYWQMVRIRDSVGKIRLINARDKCPEMDEINALSIDIDQAVVVKVGGELYHGADAVHVMALISSRSDAFNRLGYWIFKSKRISRILYPWLRAFRNLLLKVLGRPKINNLEVSGNDKF